MANTPITQRGLDWAAGVASGEILSCKRARQAVQRFHRDLERSKTDPGFPWVFDAEASEHLCTFVELCPHIEGAWAGRNETIRLSGWQAFALGQLNGWRHKETRLRRFRITYIEVPRKNGKSTLVAPVGLYFLALDGEVGAKVFSAASSTDQARIVFDIARAMALNGRFDGMSLGDRLGLRVEQHKIRSADPASVFRPIASQTKSQDGKNPHLALIDELHEHQKRDVWEAMSTAMGARDHPAIIAITTAGHNTAGICYEQRRYVERILDGSQEDESYFGLIFEADEGDDPAHPRTWAKANPNLGVSKSEVYLQDQWNKAQASPAAMGEFLRKHLNVWTSVGASAIDMDRWRKLAMPALRAGGLGNTAQAWLGVDLAIRHDFASVVAVIPRGDEKLVRSWHFLPEETVLKAGNDHYAGWWREGHIMTTPGAMLDLNIVEALVLELAGITTENDWGFRAIEPYDVQMVTVDPMYASQMAMTWEARGLPVTVLRSTASNMNVPFQNLIGLVEDERLIHDGNPVLTWMASNTMMKQVQGGDYIYPAKLYPEDKIDGITALVNALWPLSQADHGFIDIDAALANPISMTL
ncbi:terminase large subunit [Roseicyclus marinus]|uniref:terminase large subunit n=1 Tax=Roseicyclus marinus TaxID=2161673 RepID=UPI00240ED27B|nr:terminase TerL endonuclease subunit [Roseicyclus marinus]MDG3040450.1 terminase large subunit [Roseicyclus marinus]